MRAVAPLIERNAEMKRRKNCRPRCAKRRSRKKRRRPSPEPSKKSTRGVGRRTNGLRRRKRKRSPWDSADDVGVRHQKEHRAAENQKNGAFVWSTNALAQSREGERIFTCVGMKKAFLFVLAYLLDKEMLRNRSLVFSLTGQVIFCPTSRKYSRFIRIASFWTGSA